MSENIYKKYNINPSVLKRDYIKNPLKNIIPKPTGGYKFERPYKEDLEYLYITKNLELNDILKLLNLKVGCFYTILKEFNIKKTSQNRNENNIKATLKFYGVKNQFQRTEVIKISQSEENKEKRIQSKIKNGTFGGRKSIIQQELGKLLKEKYKDVYEDYKSSEYPYHCDFYIPSINLYIEYQGYLTHGDREFHCPYNELNIKHKQHVEWLKNTKPYKWKDIIDTWTIRDPLKRKIAKENNLNWIEFFNKSDFKKWIESY